jgi:hypothetical protein
MTGGTETMDRARRLEMKTAFTADVCKSKGVGYKAKKTKQQICERTKRVCGRDAEKSKSNELNNCRPGERNVAEPIGKPI